MQADRDTKVGQELAKSLHDDNQRSGGDEGGNIRIAKKPRMSGAGCVGYFERFSQHWEFRASSSVLKQVVFWYRSAYSCHLQC